MASTSTMPERFVRSRRTPPKTGTLAPHTPLRPAAAVTGTDASLHARRISPTWPTASGRTTTLARAATRSSSAQIIASGHQSRLASFTTASARMTLGAGALEAASRARRRPRRAARTGARSRRRRRRGTRSAAWARHDSLPSPLWSLSARPPERSSRAYDGRCSSASSAIAGKPPASCSARTSAR